MLSPTAEHVEHREGPLAACCRCEARFAHEGTSRPWSPTGRYGVRPFRSLPVSSEFRATPRPHGVLIAADDADVRAGLRDKLRQEGFSVWVAADGQEALDVYRGHCESIDVVLLDVCMPGLDGPRTLAELQEITPRIRCCLMSGHRGRYSEENLRDLGATTVFTKPLWLDGVAHVLAKLAGGRRRSVAADGHQRTYYQGGS